MQKSTGVENPMTSIYRNSCSHENDFAITTLEAFSRSGRSGYVCYEFRTNSSHGAGLFCAVLTFHRCCRASPKKEVQHGGEWNSEGVSLLRRERLCFSVG